MTHEVEQGTKDWHDLRCGKVTASRIDAVMAKIKSGEAATRMNYRAELIAERLTKVQVEGYVSKEMQWGKDHEDEADIAYEFFTGGVVQHIAFVDHPTIPMAGCSPDGLVGEHGLIERKCPNTATHIKYLKGKNVPSEYAYQMHFQMACTGRKWCDFVSFDPRLPERLQLFVRRLPRDEVAIKGIEVEVRQFLAELDAELNALELYARGA